MLLDAQGQPATVSDDDDLWMVDALWKWLNDRRIVRLIYRRGVHLWLARLLYDELRLEADPKRAATSPTGLLGGLMDAEIHTAAHVGRFRCSRGCPQPLSPYTPVPRPFLRKAMLLVLRDPVVRRSLVRFQAQAEIEAFQACPPGTAPIEAYPRSWRPGGLNAIRDELQTEREKLEEKMKAEETVWRPEA